jgi:hypothetical protein
MLMIRFSHAFLSVLAPVLFLAGAGSSMHVLAPRSGDNLWNARQYFRWLRLESTRDRELVHQMQQLEARRAARLAVIDAVIDGYLSLRAAASRLRVLDEIVLASDGRELRPFDPGHSAEERFCREVIYRVQLRLVDQAEAARWFTRKLEAEWTNQPGPGEASPRRFLSSGP